MLRSSYARAFSLFAMGAPLAGLAIVGCSSSSAPPSISKPAATSVASNPEKPTKAAEEVHGHIAGTHGGSIISLGRDSYHIEAIVEKGGGVRLYTLGNDESRVLAIESQDLVAYVKSQGQTDSAPIPIKPQPQPGDQTGKASLFVGVLPEDAVGKTVEITIPSITIGGERFRASFTNEATQHVEEPMPDAATDDAARALYLTPGGLYTGEDIAANGNVTAAQKFKGFQASHDLKPKIGDKICPVTLTKANPQCSWIIGGKTYEFCCPPCVDEFVALAKSDPAAIKGPQEYVKTATTSTSEAK